jgi:chromate reductase
MNIAMSTALTVLGIAGSLRKGSYNRAALRAAQKLAPEGTRIETFDLQGVSTL